MKYTSSILTSMLLAVGIIFTPLVSADDDVKDAALLSQAKITLTDAIAKANAQIPGTPFEAELERERGVVIYKVTIFNNNQKTKVLINAQTGVIISSYIDR